MRHTPDGDLLPERKQMSKTALIVGAGSGLSAALTRALTKDGYRCVLQRNEAGKIVKASLRSQ